MTKREQDGKGVYRLASVFVGNSINHKNGLCQDEMSTIIILFILNRICGRFLWNLKG